MITNLDRENFRKVWQKILSANRVFLVGHITPDVDALSSLGIFIEILKNLNKDFIAFADKKSDDYYFLPNIESVIGQKNDLLDEVRVRYNNDEELGDDWLKFFDVLITLDCGSLKRTSLEEEITDVRYLMLDTFMVEIDHHVEDKSYANIEIKSQLASNTELIYYFLKENKIDVNKNIANCVLAGILTDTSNFLYSSANENTMRIASDMMSLGAQFPKILQGTWRNKNFSEMKIWGIALKNLKINNKYNIAFSVLKHEDLQEIKSSGGDLGSDVFGDIVAFMSSLSEAKTFLLLREDEPGVLKGSFRVGSAQGSEKIDVAKLASYLGGGGHKKAAGFMIKAHLENNNNIFRLV